MLALIVAQKMKITGIRRMVSNALYSISIFLRLYM